jgi:hypothetical protein
VPNKISVCSCVPLDRGLTIVYCLYQVLSKEGGDHASILCEMPCQEGNERS